MNASTQTGSHDQILRLLPFFVNDSLTGVERERVAKHLNECDACRAEAEATRSVLAQLASPVPQPSANDALRRVRPRLEPERRWRALAE